jgi:hypothetical protein
MDIWHRLWIRGIGSKKYIKLWRRRRLNWWQRRIEKIPDEVGNASCIYSRKMRGNIVEMALPSGFTEAFAVTPTGSITTAVTQSMKTNRPPLWCLFPRWRAL